MQSCSHPASVIQFNVLRWPCIARFMEYGKEDSLEANDGLRNLRLCHLLVKHFNIKKFIAASTSSTLIAFSNGTFTLVH